MPPKNLRDRASICDYEGSNYRTEFWEGQGREYEDKVERIALRKLLPPKGGARMLEVGAGFGRLTDEYHHYRQVVLLDYSFSQLQYAQEQLGRSGRYIFVAADAYKLPFRPGLFDGVSMVRVLHHMADVPAVLAQIRKVLAADGVFILEHANKRNLKAMLRYVLKKQDWSPYELAPVEFVELNFDFHPAYIVNELQAAGFRLERRIPVSFFRIPALKDRIPVGMLAALDGLLQHTGLLYTPSIFTRSTAQGDTPDNTQITSVDSLFVCPETGSPLQREGDTLYSPQSGLRYAVRDGIYDFKAPLD
jgi:SAM-dependent methyltransferase